MKVLVVVATEMDGHAAADAFKGEVTDYSDPESIKEMLTKHLVSEPSEININTIQSREGVWELYGWTFDETYNFAAVVTPTNYSHISTQTG